LKNINQVPPATGIVPPDRLCPGDRITLEDTPEYLEAACKALLERLKHSDGDLGLSDVSFAYVWDAQIFDRLYEGEKALEQLQKAIETNVMDNMLIAVFDWRNKKSGWFYNNKVFLIEACIGIVASIAEMFFQDRRAF